MQVWMTTNEAVEYLAQRGRRIAPQTLNNYCRQGKIPARKETYEQGQRWMIEQDTIDKVAQGDLPKSPSSYHNQKVPDGFLTTAQAAEYLERRGIHLTRDTLRQYAKNGTIPATRFEYAWGFREHDLDAPFKDGWVCPVCGVHTGSTYTQEQAQKAGMPELAGYPAEFYRKTPTGKLKSPKCRVCYYGGRLPKVVGQRGRELYGPKGERKHTLPQGYVLRDKALEISGLQKYHELAWRVAQNQIRVVHVGRRSKPTVGYHVKDLEIIARQNKKNKA